MAWLFEGDLNMKKTLIVIVNAIIMAGILVFVVLYSRFDSKDAYQRHIEHLENSTVTIEHVTENYLEGEQRICDVWARYINNKAMTMQEAVDFIRASHVLANTSAHLISLDTLTGLSTRPKQGTTDDYDISYKRVGLLEDVSWIDVSSKTSLRWITCRHRMHITAVFDELSQSYGGFPEGKRILLKVC